METSPQALQIPLCARCLGCGYALRGLTEPRCPECGRAFDPANRATMDLPQYFERPGSSGTFGGQMIGAAVCTVIFAAISHVPDYGKSLWHLIIASAWVGMLFAWLIRRSNQNARHRLPEGPQSWRKVVKVCLLLSMLLCVRIVPCAHTTSVGFGPIGLSFGGRPCHNPPHDGGIHLFGSVWFTQFRDLP